MSAPASGVGDGGRSLGERFAEWAGPLVVKEVRQGLKSRAFAVAFGLMLLAGFGVTFVSGAMTERGGAPLGARAFWLSCSAFAVYGQLFIPFLAYRAMVREREDETWVLLVLTGLGADGIVRGKHLTALLQLGLGAAATAPFMLFSYLLSGVGLPSLLLALWWQVGLSFLLVTVGVGLGAQANGPRERTAGHFVMLGLSVVLGGPSLALTGALSHEGERMLRDGEVWGLLSLLPVAMGLVARCIPPAAAAALSLPSEPRSGPARRAVAGTFALGVLTAAFLIIVLEAKGDVAALVSVPNALALLVVGFFSVSERHPAGRPVREAWFDQPGPFRSTTIAFVLLAFSALAFFLASSMRDGRHGAAAIAGPAFVVLYLSLGLLLGRYTPLSQLGPAVGARLGFAIATALGIAVPASVALVTGDRVDRGLGWMFNPFFGMIRFLDKRGLEEEVLVLAGAAGLAGLIALMQLASECREAEA
ncbi:MAG: hypothetical protein SFW67_30955 [Myxococcaceae bacterium]|nr:hypothetical protein [Myxococcaceae bacterium]